MIYRNFRYATSWLKLLNSLQPVKICKVGSSLDNSYVLERLTPKGKTSSRISADPMDGDKIVDGQDIGCAVLQIGPALKVL